MSIISPRKTQAASLDEHDDVPVATNLMKITLGVNQALTAKATKPTKVTTMKTIIGMMTRIPSPLLMSTFLSSVSNFLDLGCQWILLQFRMVQVTQRTRLNDWRLKANSAILRWKNAASPSWTA